MSGEDFTEIMESFLTEPAAGPQNQFESAKPFCYYGH